MKKEKYKYFMHGLKIESEIRLYGKLSEFDIPDVEILIGKVPKEIEGAIINRRYTTASNTECIEYAKNVASFYAKLGKQIIVEPVSDVEDSVISIFIEGRAITAILNQRNVLTLHGSGVVKNKKGILIVGHSGAGKTSLTTGLLNSGFMLLTDDIIALDVKEQRLFIYPGMPVQKISKKLISKYEMEDFIIDKVDYPGVRHDKYHVNRMPLYKSEITEIDTIIYVTPHDGEIDLIQIKGMEKIEMLIRNIYRKDFANLFIGHSEQFRRLNNLASNCSVYLLKRQVGIDTIEEQIELLSRRNIL